MAVHELATNAAKYGTLSIDTGRIEVSWSLEPGDAAGESFVMSWRESGGSVLVTSPARRGFGWTVLCQVAKESLDAEVKLDFASSGLVWRLQCPSAEVMGTKD